MQAKIRSGGVGSRVVVLTMSWSELELLTAAMQAVLQWASMRMGDKTISDMRDIADQLLEVRDAQM